MAHFFFDLRVGEETITDRVGLQRADRDAARIAAMTALPDIIKHGLPDLDAQEFVILVREECGDPFFSVAIGWKSQWLE